MRRINLQTNGDNGRIYGRAPIPGARYEVNGVFYDSRGCECMLPGVKARPVPEPEPEPEPELTEDELKLQQFVEFVSQYQEDEQKGELRNWMRENLGVNYSPNIGLATLRERAVEDYRRTLAAGDSDE